MMRGLAWSVESLRREVRHDIDEALANEGSTSRFVSRYQRIGRYCELIRRKGGDLKEFAVDIDVIDRQLDLVQQQLAVAREMIRGVRAQPAADAAPPPRAQPADPIKAVVVEAAHYTMMGLSWDMFCDRIDTALMRDAIGRYCSTPGLGMKDGRRDPTGFRQHIMSQVPQPAPGKAVA